MATDEEDTGRSPNIWASMGVCAVTRVMGAGQLLDAKLAVPAAIPAAGQKAMTMMSNQKLALSQVFPL